MKKASLSLAVIIISSALFFTFNPHSVSAARIATDATVLNTEGTRGLFVVIFTLRAFGSDIYLPLSSLRGTSTNPHDVGAVFSFIDNTDTLKTTGTSNSIILGTTTIENGMYKITEGSRATFAVVSSLTTQEQTESRYRMRIDSLKYFTENDRKNAVNYPFTPGTLQTKLLKLR